MIPLVLIRHGKTEWNLAKKLQGRRDIPLCPKGVSNLQKCQIPQEFQEYNWVSSPLKRAVQTAQLLGAKEIDLDDRLIEMDFGLWEGHTIKDLRAHFGGEMIQNESLGLDMKPPKGESPRHVRERLLSFLTELKSPTIAVTHKGVMRAMQSLAYNWDMKNELPVAYQWEAAHLFFIGKDGQPTAERPNIRLEKP